MGDWDRARLYVNLKYFTPHHFKIKECSGKIAQKLQNPQDSHMCHKFICVIPQASQSNQSFHSTSVQAMSVHTCWGHSDEHACLLRTITKFHLVRSLKKYTHVESYSLYSMHHIRNINFMMPLLIQLASFKVFVASSSAPLHCQFCWPFLPLLAIPWNESFHPAAPYILAMKFPIRGNQFACLICRNELLTPSSHSLIPWKSAYDYSSYHLLSIITTTLME